MLNEGRILSNANGQKILTCRTCGSSWEENKEGKFCPKCKLKEVKNHG